MSIAIVAWQRSVDSPLGWILVAISLGAMVSLHYYAIFVWPAFAIAEAFVVVSERRIRKAMWLAFILGAMPLLAWWKLLKRLHEYYGQNFWAHLGILDSFTTFNWLFNLTGHSGSLVAITLAALFAVWKFAPSREDVQQGTEDVRPNQMPIREWVLAFML
jgi:hypothetical protein